MQMISNKSMFWLWSIKKQQKRAVFSEMKKRVTMWQKVHVDS